MLKRIALAILILSGIAHAKPLSDSTYKTYRNAILPSAAEMAWRKIPWRSTFWEGVVEAQDRRMPMLIWAMNGHPLACT